EAEEATRRSNVSPGGSAGARREWRGSKCDGNVTDRDPSVSTHGAKGADSGANVSGQSAKEGRPFGSVARRSREERRCGANILATGPRLRRPARGGVAPPGEPLALQCIVRVA